jgi:hypothetical protein
LQYRYDKQNPVRQLKEGQAAMKKDVSILGMNMDKIKQFNNMAAVIINSSSGKYSHAFQSPLSRSGIDFENPQNDESGCGNDTVRQRKVI